MGVYNTRVQVQLYSESSSPSGSLKVSRTSYLRGLHYTCKLGICDWTPSLLAVFGNTLVLSSWGTLTERAVLRLDGHESLRQCANQEEFIFED
jgi:hypothetical protein